MQNNCTTFKAGANLLSDANLLRVLFSSNTVLSWFLKSRINSLEPVYSHWTFLYSSSGGSYGQNTPGSKFAPAVKNTSVCKLCIWTRLYTAVNLKYLNLSHLRVMKYDSTPCKVSYRYLIKPWKGVVVKQGTHNKHISFRGAFCFIWSSHFMNSIISLTASCSLIWCAINFVQKVNKYFYCLRYVLVVHSSLQV